MADAQRPKIKRLQGEAYWKLTALLERGDKLINEYGEWARKECRRLKLIPDVTDLVLGVVWNVPESMVSPELPRQQVALIDDEDVIAEALRRQAEVDEINAEISELTRKIAMSAGVRADQINVRSGLIRVAPADDVEDLVVDV